MKIKNVAGLIRRVGLNNTIQFYMTRTARKKDDLKKIQEYHLPDPKEIEEQQKTQFPYEPKISIVTPLYNTPRKFLEELLESVENQTYGNWELCLADGSTQEYEYVGEICKEHIRHCPKIKYQKLVKNEGIVGNTNQCLAMASGEYIGLLDHDDLLHVSALYEVVCAIQDGADFIYTDELKFEDSVENSANIVCKNAFGKEELRSHNYICHFVTFKHALLHSQEELFRGKCEGSQDYDMVLRLTESAEKIIHIPKILYYWRVHSGSVAMDVSVKSYAIDAAKCAISDALIRSGEVGKVECNFPYQSVYKIDYNINGEPKISIILWGTDNAHAYAKQIKQIVGMTNYKNIEIIVPVSRDLETEGSVSVIEMESETPEYISWIQESQDRISGDYLLFLNVDCVPLTARWVEELLMYACRSGVGIVGAKIQCKHSGIYYAGAVLDQNTDTGIHAIISRVENIDGYEANLEVVRNTSVLSAICMMISREKYDILNGCEHAMGICADADLALKCIQQGYRNVWTCFAKMRYTGSEKPWQYWQENPLFKTKWQHEISKRDIYYHPLLEALEMI